MTDIELIPNSINVKTLFYFLLLLLAKQCFSISLLYCYVDFFTYNDRYDEENYEYDYPEEGGHEINEEAGWRFSGASKFNIL